MTIIIMSLLPQRRVWIPRVEGVTQLCSQEGPPSFGPSVQLPIPVPPPCCVTGPWGKGQVRKGKEPGPRALPGEWGTGGVPKGRQPSGQWNSSEGPSAAQTQPGPCNPGQENICAQTPAKALPLHLPSSPFYLSTGVRTCTFRVRMPISVGQGEKSTGRRMKTLLPGKAQRKSKVISYWHGEQGDAMVAQKQRFRG